MIRKLVDFALNNRFIILVIAALLFGWGAISFHNLPVEAYPDVANNYVNVITRTRCSVRCSMRSLLLLRRICQSLYGSR